MDKYDRQAAEIVFKNFGVKADMILAAVIAAALRESAAEAFEEAADFIRNHAALHGTNSMCDLVKDKVAALRSTTRGKGA